jgi:hypothetical protein
VSLRKKTQAPATVAAWSVSDLSALYTQIAHHLSLKPAEFFEAMLMQQRLSKMPFLNLSWLLQS